jgi:lariat debranching enzyme
VDTSHIEEVIGPTTDGGRAKGRSLRMAVQGCLHGELDSVYDTLLAYERQSSSKIDVLVCCGDFQSLRNQGDLPGMAVPDKYKTLGQFHAYYSGQKVAPILTLFVGGNHEASAYLQELPYGGWVAPNIYYMGLSNVLSLHIQGTNPNLNLNSGIRVGGLSGIYKSHDYHMGRHECPPYDRSSLRSVYHVRHVDVYRLTCLSSSSLSNKKMHVMVSHDWPRGVEQHGDTEGLLRKKPFFRQEVQENNLGSPAAETILMSLQPKWWFAAHLHVKFTATISHHNNNKEESSKPTPTSTRLVPSQVVAGQSKPQNPKTPKPLPYGKYIGKNYQ